MILSSFFHSVFVLVHPDLLRLDANVTIYLFLAFLNIILPVFWYFDKVALNLEAGCIGCSALEQEDIAQLARFAVVELEFAILHQFGHHFLVHGEEEKVIEVRDDD